RNGDSLAVECGTAAQSAARASEASTAILGIVMVQQASANARDSVARAAVGIVETPDPAPRAGRARRSIRAPIEPSGHECTVNRVPGSFAGQTRRRVA